MPATTISAFRGEHRFLSNFHPVPGGVSVHAYGTVLTAPTTEHLYQALKSDREIDHLIVCSARTPREAKARGRQVLMRPDWDDVRGLAMKLCLEAKFSAEHPELRAALLATGSAKLIEGNDWGDRYWGVDLATGEGRNRLGIELMALRERIRNIG